MKRRPTVAFFCIMAIFHSMIACAADDITLSTTATLRDGSILKGTLVTDTVAGAAIFDNALKLKAETIQSISFTDTNGTAKATLVNDDILTLTVTTPAFDMNTSLGKLSLVRGNVKSLSITKRKSAVADNAGLIFHCTFDDPTSITSPAIGQAGKINNAKFQAGKANNALLVTRGLSACEFPLPAGSLSDKGCIEFWAKFMDGKTEFTTGGDPRFFTLYNANGGNCGLFEYASNNGMGKCGLSGVFGDAVTSHSGFSHMMPYSSIFKGCPLRKLASLCIGLGYQRNRQVRQWQQGTSSCYPFRREKHRRDLQRNFRRQTSRQPQRHRSQHGHSHELNRSVIQQQVFFLDRRAQDLEFRQNRFRRLTYTR